MKKFLLGIVFVSCTILSTLSVAHPQAQVSSIPPQPTTCVKSTFTSTGTRDWSNIVLTLKNSCTTGVDLQNVTVTFQNQIALNTNLWGNFNPLPYPDNNPFITSQASGSNYLATFSLHFPSYGSSVLPVNKSIQIMYGASSEGHIGSANVYLNGGSSPSVGNVALSNSSTQPSDVTQSYALVHITSNGASIADVQLPWKSSKTINGLAVGNYQLSADSINGTSGNSYIGSAAPASISVVQNQTVSSTVSYTVLQQLGKLAIQLQALPNELSGYTGKPTAQVTQSGTGSSVQVPLNWNTSSTVTQLKNGSTYSFSTSAISYNGYTCQPTFTPSTVAASATTLPVTNLTYACTPAAQSNVSLNITGGPGTLNSLKVTLTPNNSTSPVVQTIALTNGAGSGMAALTTGTIYTVSSDAVTGYTVKFSPQPITAANGAVETITLAPQASGGTPVDINGQLTVCGTQLCNQNGQPIQLKGMSSHGIQWYGWQGSNTQKACLTTASLDTLANVWKASVVRISMYVQEGGYETDPAGFTQQVNALIDEATKRGMYAIVDWHILTPGDPNVNLAKAKTFFTAIANAHKNNNNLLYEIANEPNGVSWASIKTYAEALIPVIRAIDNKTPILIGTRGWSSLGLADGSSSQEIINNPVNATNIMYTFHFYAASHGANYLNEVDKASNTLPIFVSEFGTQQSSGDGPNNFTMSDQYLQLFARKKISWANWNYSDDSLSGATWVTGTCSNGPWTDNKLKPAGVYVKANILSN